MHTIHVTCQGELTRFVKRLYTTKGKLHIIHQFEEIHYLIPLSPTHTCIQILYLCYYWFSIQKLKCALNRNTFLLILFDWKLYSCKICYTCISKRIKLYLGKAATKLILSYCLYSCTILIFETTNIIISLTSEYLRSSSSKALERLQLNENRTKVVVHIMV